MSIFTIASLILGYIFIVCLVYVWWLRFIEKSGYDRGIHAFGMGLFWPIAVPGYLTICFLVHFFTKLSELADNREHKWKGRS